MDNDDPRDELIARATRYAKVGADPYRYMILREFCRPFKRVLSVGSAGYEPIRIGATHALDLRPLAGEYLKKEGWKGKYFVGSCTKLPFNDGEFDVGVCSEVIEHLEKMEDVEKAISEVNRVCKNWVITTPAVWVPEPDHKHLFTAEQILGWVNKYQAAAPCRYLVKVYTREIWHFLVKRHISQLRNCPFCKHKLPKGAWHD